MARHRLWATLVFPAFLTLIIYSSPRQIAASTIRAFPSISHAAAARFLEQATWGPSGADIANVRKIGLDAWFAQQLSAPVSSFPPDASVPFPTNGVAAGVLLTNAVNGSDQLRQRMAFTLGEIWVVSNYVLPEPDAMEYYQQMLQDNAFSNYRQLMQAETLNPSMGYYLNVANNFKANPARGTQANENYARELLQLFTIGTLKNAQSIR